MIREKHPAMAAEMAEVLELASWAPSGDNTQPWRFEVLGDRHLVVHGFDTRTHCVYDLDGHPSQIAIGCLLETTAIAASAHGWRLDAQRRPGGTEDAPTFDLRFHDDPSVRPDDLIPAIRLRSVQRRPMKTRPLTSAEKSALEASVGALFRVRWLEGFANRRRTANLMFRSAKVRLTMPEAYTVHRDVIEWGVRFSTDRVPDQALGVGRSTLRLMRFVMKSWPRVEFFNRYLAGTWAPRIEMDWVPGLACAAHFVLAAREPPVTVDDYVVAGRAVQRFWLTAARLGLVLQPELTPLIFARYARAALAFTSTPGIGAQAQRLASRLDDLLGVETSRRAVFMGRIGSGPQATSRSIRSTVEQLTRVRTLDTVDR